MDGAFCWLNEKKDGADPSLIESKEDRMLVAP